MPYHGILHACTIEAQSLLNASKGVQARHSAEFCFVWDTVSLLRVESFDSAFDSDAGQQCFEVLRSLPGWRTRYRKAAGFSDPSPWYL